METVARECLVETIAATVSAPWSNMDALRTDVEQYAGRLYAAGTSLELVLVRLHSVCRPSIQPGLAGTNRAWTKYVLDRIVCWAIDCRSA